MNFRDDQSQPLFVECISVYVMYVSTGIMLSAALSQ